MTTDILSSGTSTSICCFYIDGDPIPACHWNVTFLIAATIISEIVDLKTLLPSDWLPCPSDVACYPKFTAADNDSMYFLDNGKTFVNGSVGTYRACRLGGDDYCFNTDEPVTGTESLANTCASFFNWLLYINNNTVEFNINKAEDELYSLTLCYTISLCISLPFFIVTFVIYTILPELNNCHGFVLRNYLMSCFVGFLTLATEIANWLPGSSCNLYLGLIRHFALLSMFFWLNIMSFDMWQTFRLIEHRRKQSFRKKQIIYSICAWGSSLLIIAVGAIIEFVPNLPEGLIKPGLKGCYLIGHPPFMAYFQGPMCITLITNIFFFAATAITIFRHRNESAQHLEGSDSRRNDAEKYRFYIYLKLLILTGMQWCSEVIELMWDDPGNYITFFLDLPHLLQGLILFIIFVWNDRIKRLLSARLGLKNRSIRQWIGLHDLQNSNTSTTGTCPNS